MRRDEKSLLKRLAHLEEKLTSLGEPQNAPRSDEKRQGIQIYIYPKDISCLKLFRLNWQKVGRVNLDTEYKQSRG